MADSERHLLPTHLRPSCYDIKLEPDFEGESLSGRVEICCDVVEPTWSIQLHAKYISINEAWVKAGDKALDILGGITYDKSHETVHMRLPEQLVEGTQVTVTLEYTGKFRDDQEGFYQSSYETEEGTEYHVAATSLEPTYARQVFPCFDEPSVKAEYIISAVVDSSFACVSNMPVDRTESVSDSKMLVVFQRSPLMSTYLVGLIAGPLAQVKSTEGAVPLSVFCPIGRENEAQFALGLAAKGLQLFESYFDIPYPLPKLDLVAVPGFPGGAIESWGVITGRTTSLLLDPEDSSLDSKRGIADAVLHEVAHMWFGNLVTMRYWDGLWLKEGCATLLAWIAMDKMFPSWRIWDSYVAENLQSALNLDALQGSHPIEMVVKDAALAKQIYDDICYEKGCCVLKMISDELGEERFLEGLKLYLHRHQYKSTESDNLWKALEDVSGKPLSSTAHVWTREAGFPVVHVTGNFGKDNEIQAYHLRQERFLASGKNEGLAHTPIYPLQVAIHFGHGIQTIGLNSHEVAVPAVGEEALLKVNADHTGFFRTSYSPHLLKKLIEAAGEGQLGPRDCVGLSCDLKALVSAGVNRTSELLELCLHFRQSNTYLLWQSIVQNLDAVRATWKFHDDKLRLALGDLARDVLGPKTRELGLDITDDDDVQVMFKTAVFGAAGVAGDANTVAQARTMFAKRLATGESAIQGSLRSHVFVIIAANAEMADVEALFDIWKNSSNEDEQYYALEALGRARTAEQAEWVLSHALTNSVGNDDLDYLLCLLGRSPHGAVALWAWAKENWESLEEQVPAESVCGILDMALGGLHTAEHIEDVRAFFAKRDTSAYQMVLDQQLEGMENRERWAERDLQDVRSWLRDRKYL